jgi:exoribonuclease II
VSTAKKYLGAIVEYLDEGRLKPALAVREQGEQVVLLDAGGRQKTASRDLILLSYSEYRAEPGNLAEVIATVESERARLASELDLNLLWEVVHEQGRSFGASELAELFFGERSTAGTSVMLEALLNDRLYFVRRHMEFMARSSEQVERLRLQYERIQLRSESGRRTRDLIRQIIDAGVRPSAAEAVPLAAELTRYLQNPFTRSRELTTMLSAALPETDPAEAAFEILERLGAAPAGPRFVIIGGIKTEFSAEAMREAATAAAPVRQALDGGLVVAIDDEDTVEVDDALGCELLPDGTLKVRVHIALASDFVVRDGAIDREAASRGATVYLPEATVMMLPEEISCTRASLVAGEERSVLVTEARLGPDGELLSSSIYPARARITSRLTYERADELLAASQENGDEVAATLRRLHGAAMKLRERRRRAGALLVQRRETKIRVSDDSIELKVIDSSSPSRTLVAEFMVLSNHVAARFAADNRVPIIYRVQPNAGSEGLIQRSRLSLYPEDHVGVGLDRYAQLSSPLRRYADLVLQRQLVAVLLDPRKHIYQPDELLTVLANAENTEAEAKELERRAKRYWALRFLERHALGRPLEATVLRDGASAELDAYAVRGALHGAPNITSQSRVLVQIARVDPLRGWLTLDYVRTVPNALEEAH